MVLFLLQIVKISFLIHFAIGTLIMTVFCKGFYFGKKGKNHPLACSKNYQKNWFKIKNDTKAE